MLPHHRRRPFREDDFPFGESPSPFSSRAHTPLNFPFLSSCSSFRLPSFSHKTDLWIISLRMEIFFFLFGFFVSSCFFFRFLFCSICSSPFFQVEFYLYICENTERLRMPVIDSIVWTYRSYVRFSFLRRRKKVNILETLLPGKLIYIRTFCCE